MSGLFLTIDITDALDKFWHFFLVGGGGFTVDICMTFSILKGWGWPKYVSNSIGFASGMTFNYYFNRTWTFASHNPDILVQYAKFTVIGVVGLLIVNGMVYILHTRNRVPFFWAKVLAMIVFMFWNFSANYLYTFQT